MPKKKRGKKSNNTNKTNQPTKLTPPAQAQEKAQQESVPLDCKPDSAQSKPTPLPSAVIAKPSPSKQTGKNDETDWLEISEQDGDTPSDDGETPSGDWVLLKVTQISENSQPSGITPIPERTHNIA